VSICGAAVLNRKNTLLPFTWTSDVAEAKMVEFILTPNVPADSELDMAIRDALRARVV
jgi:hypothetical protein